MSEKKADPAPLGLLGFGMTTVLVSFVLNARLGKIDGMILGMGIFYGGLAQIIAGVMEYRRGNTFGMVAFSSYGFFWLSFVALNWLGVPGVASAGVWPFSTIGPDLSGYSTPWAIGSEALMTYFIMWGLFTLFMFVGTLKKNRAIQMVFGSLTVLFFLLATLQGIEAYGSVATNDLNLFTQIIGIEGMICGFSAFYLAMAHVLNEEYGRTVLPIGPVEKQAM
jgi:succinate-acetate transporter protein